MSKKPILKEFPSVFESERLTIRAPRPGDGPELNAAILETLEELKPWMPWARDIIPTVEDSEENIRRAYSRFITRDDLRLNLYLKGTDTFVGGSGLHDIDWDVPRFEIGYWCRKRFMGQGYVTEAVRAITAFTFDVLGARRIEIRCDAKNVRSRLVAERAGYELEAVLRNDERSYTGELRDTLVFAQIRPDPGFPEE